MTDRERLLRAIAAEPDEDTPRLAFADLVEEEGDPERGAFIRAHVGASAAAVWDAPKGPKKSDSPGDYYTMSCPGRWVPSIGPGDFLRFENEGPRFGRPIAAVRHGGVGEKTEVEFGLPVVLPAATVDPWRRGVERERASSLWRANFAEWFDDVNRIVTPKLSPLWIDDRIIRGFVESITTTCPLWLAHGPAVVRAHPTVREVRLSDVVIYESGGNMTYYVGGLGRFPREYWSRLDNLPSLKAARDAISSVCLELATAAQPAVTG